MENLELSKTCNRHCPHQHQHHLQTLSHTYANGCVYHTLISFAHWNESFTCFYVTRPTNTQGFASVLTSAAFPSEEEIGPELDFV